jgi:signal transduction histidine kinase
MKLLENIFKDSQERVSERVTPFFDHLEKMSFEVNEDNLVGYYKIQFEEMKEELSQTHELAQLGIAVEIIDHQFNALYSQLAESIRSLKSYLLPSKNATNRYHNLDVAFEHLRDNYSLLQPLYRTVGRVRKEINGAELKEYVEEFFKNTLEDNEIKLTISKKAEEWSVFSYESIFKAVTINIVNNAIYWLQPVEKREIKIDVIDDNLLIMNSGEPIADYQLEEIFRMFYSNRPKGRGIGLYLAKINLKGIGYEIKATNDPKYSQLNGACFSIYKKES